MSLRNSPYNMAAPLFPCTVEEQRSVIRFFFLWSEDVKPSEIYRKMNFQYGDSCLSQGRMNEWVERFQNGRRKSVVNTGVGDQLAWQLRQWNSRSSSESVTTGESYILHKSTLPHKRKKLESTQIFSTTFWPSNMKACHLDNFNSLALRKFGKYKIN